MASPIVGSVSSPVAYSTALSHSVPVPSGTMAGDLLVAFYSQDVNNASMGFTIPSDWSHVTGSPTESLTGAIGSRLQVATKIAPGTAGSPTTDTANYTFTRSPSGWAVLVVVRIPVDAGGATPIIHATAVNNNNASTRPVLSAPLTTSAADCLILTVMAWDESKGKQATAGDTTATVVNYSGPGNHAQNLLSATMASAGTYAAQQTQLSGPTAWSTMAVAIAYPAGGAAAYTLTASTSAVTLSRKAAGLPVARTLPVPVKALLLTGQNVGINRGYPLVAAVKSFILSGQAVSLKATRYVAVSAGSFVLSGQPTGLKSARVLPSSPGARTLTGINAVLRVARGVAGSAGAFTLAGNATGLTYTPAAGAYTLTAGAGAFALAANDAGLTYAPIAGEAPRQRGDDAPQRRRTVFVYREAPKQPEQQPATNPRRIKRKVTPAIVAEAISILPVGGLFSLPQAELVVPEYIVIPKVGASEDYALTVRIVAQFLQQEAQRRAEEDDEDDLELLMLAA